MTTLTSTSITHSYCIAVVQVCVYMCTNVNLFVKYTACIMYDVLCTCEQELAASERLAFISLLGFISKQREQFVVESGSTNATLSPSLQVPTLQHNYQVFVWCELRVRKQLCFILLTQCHMETWVVVEVQCSMHTCI